MLVRRGPARRVPPTECVDIHGRGQDARDRGQLSEAKRLFVLCAQPSSPLLIQSDGSKFGEEVNPDGAFADKYFWTEGAKIQLTE